MGNAQQVKRGWFTTDGRLGDRTLESQMLGLGPVFDACKGKTVLDLGCAEGLLSCEFARRGAVAVHGVEVVAEHVEVGRKLVGDLPVTLEVGDLNTWRPRRSYDIVLALALLHKLRNPAAAARELFFHANDLVVLRMPPATGMTVVDARSGNTPYNIATVMDEEGFVRVHQSNDGPFGEYVAIWRRM